jgi:hypothetical protein
MRHVNEKAYWGQLTLLHLGDEILVEQTAGLLVQRAVDGDHVTLGEHLLEILDTAAANLLLDLGLQRLVVIVKKLLAVEGLQTTEHTLTDTADSDGTDDLVLQVEFVLGDSSNVPLTITDLLVGGNEVADEGEDGHDNVLSDGDDVAASDLGDGDTTVGLVGGVQVDMVRTDTSGDGDLEVLGLGQALSGEVSGVESIGGRSVVCYLLNYIGTEDSRSGDDDLSVDQLLVKGGVLTLLVGGSDEGVALLLEPFSQAQLVLGGTQETGLLLGVLTALIGKLARGSGPAGWESWIGNIRHRGPSKLYPVDSQRRLAYVHRRFRSPEEKPGMDYSTASERSARRGERWQAAGAGGRKNGEIPL